MRALYKADFEALLNHLLARLLQMRPTIGLSMKFYTTYVEIKKSYAAVLEKSRLKVTVKLGDDSKYKICVICDIIYKYSMHAPTLQG